MKNQKPGSKALDQHGAALKFVVILITPVTLAVLEDFLGASQAGCRCGSAMQKRKHPQSWWWLTKAGTTFKLRTKPQSLLRGDWTPTWLQSTLQPGFWCKSKRLRCKNRLPMEKVAISSCGCPFSGTIQGQVGWDFEQPGLMGGVPAYGNGSWDSLILKTHYTP